jgi:hypothetical protein
VFRPPTGPEPTTDPMPKKVWLAAVLWLVLAAVVWNVVFDRVVVLAGRRFVHDATVSARAGVYLRIDDTMRPAVADGVRLASLVSVPIAILGLAAVSLASRRDRRSTSSKNDSARGSFD